MITEQEILSAKILIVDDQKLHSFYLEKVLSNEGYLNVKCTLDSRHAQTMVNTYQPDILILDIHMPHLDGFQVMAQLAKYREQRYLPILAISADKDSELRLRALQSGATDILLQPYELVEILFRIRNMVEMRLLHVQVEQQNKILETRVQERTKELRESQLDIIRRLGQAAEFRDNDTGKHIVRMSHYCERLGRALGFSSEECEILLNASPLHDVGKIGIPDRILLKPGKLTDDEFEIMKTHTTIGAELLDGSPSSVMKMAQKIALTHHEKWNGAGYPRQLQGDTIPLEGQVCSVCDVFDALTSQRPYKRAWSTDEAIAEMLNQKEKQFNPRLVDVFITILPDIENIRIAHSE